MFRIELRRRPSATFARTTEQRRDIAASSDANDPLTRRNGHLALTNWRADTTTTASASRRAIGQR
jgi:hypothetical protein